MFIRFKKDISKNLGASSRTSTPIVDRVVVSEQRNA